MAKQCMIEREKKRKKSYEKHKAKRKLLRAIINDPVASLDAKFDAQKKMADIGRDASASRQRNRCGLTGRPRGNYKVFGLSRMAIRENLMFLPGIQMASWS